MSDATPETWLPVPRFEGFYEGSDLGQVRSLHRKTPHILRPSWYTGYGVVMLHRDGVREPRTVHSIIMETFVGPCPPGKEVRHLDGNPANNRWAPGITEEEIRAAGGNLIYGSSGENKVDQVRHGTHYEASRDYCDAGHEFTPENTRIDCWPDGSFKQRVCRACARDAAAELRQKRQADERRCKEDGCEKPYFGSGWCSMHYARNRRAQPGGAEKIAAQNAEWYQRRKDEGRPTWVPSADLPPDQLERRRAQGRERAKRYRDKRNAS